METHYCCILGSNIKRKCIKSKLLGHTTPSGWHSLRDSIILFFVSGCSYSICIDPIRVVNDVQNSILLLISCVDISDKSLHESARFMPYLPSFVSFSYFAWINTIFSDLILYLITIYKYRYIQLHKILPSQRHELHVKKRCRTKSDRLNVAK